MTNVPTSFPGAMAQTDLVRLKLFGLAKRTIDERRAKGRNIPGLLRLLGYAYRVFKPRGIVLTETQGFKMYLDATDDVMTPDILVYGVHEPDETESIRNVLRPGMTVLDIGANTGYYSLLAANLVGNQGRVYAFEPEPHNFRLLTENIRLNQLTNIIAIQKALSDKTGKMKLFKDKWNFGAHTAAQNNIEVEKGECIEVDTITLDDFCAAEDITQVDYIKADVQGSEGLVFQHAETLLRNKALKILMEFWPDGLRNLGTDPGRLLELFRKHHFDFCVLGDRGIDKISGTDELVKRAERERYLNLLLEKGYVRRPERAGIPSTAAGADDRAKHRAVEPEHRDQCDHGDDADQPIRGAGDGHVHQARASTARARRLKSSR